MEKVSEWCEKNEGRSVNQRKEVKVKLRIWRGILEGWLGLELLQYFVEGFIPSENRDYPSMPSWTCRSPRINPPPAAPAAAAAAVRPFYSIFDWLDYGLILLNCRNHTQYFYQDARFLLGGPHAGPVRSDTLIILIKAARGRQDVGWMQMESDESACDRCDGV
jgi:hypothetical protein